MTLQELKMKIVTDCCFSEKFSKAGGIAHVCACTHTYTHTYTHICTHTCTHTNHENLYISNIITSIYAQINILHVFSLLDLIKHQCKFHYISWSFIECNGVILILSEVQLWMLHGMNFCAGFPLICWWVAKAKIQWIIANIHCDFSYLQWLHTIITLTTLLPSTPFPDQKHARQSDWEVGTFHQCSWYTWPLYLVDGHWRTSFSIDCVVWAEWVT